VKVFVNQEPWSLGGGPEYDEFPEWPTIVTVWFHSEAEPLVEPGLDYLDDLTKLSVSDS
jgi:hypothetical protein